MTEPTKRAAAELHIERQPDCWTLVLDRPDKANALSEDLVEALIAAVTDAEASGVPVLAFRGEGRNFSAGFDFTGFEEQSQGDLLQRFVRLETLLQQVARSHCLTVAFAQGRNFGAGVDLVGACRWRVAAAGSTFRMPGLAFGLVLGTRRFAAVVGRERAREILEGLVTFDAARAREIGFANRVAAEEAWPALLGDAVATVGAIPVTSRAALYKMIDPATDAQDMADLVRSASAPGLKDRIREFLAAQQRQRAAAA
jgi:enoyl-CoA hydratase/carnithine racemase